VPYKRRRGWWGEYGVYIQKSPTRDVWIVGFGGMGSREGGPAWEFDSFEDAEQGVAEFIETFWDDKTSELVDLAVEGGIRGRRSWSTPEVDSEEDLRIIRGALGKIHGM